MEGCAAALSAYKTSLDDDLQELRRAEPGSRRAAAIRVRNTYFPIVSILLTGSSSGSYPLLTMRPIYLI